MTEKRELHISGGFGILLGVLLFFDDQNIIPWALLACFLHEMGHVAAIHLLGGRVQAFRLSVVGAEIVPSRAKIFSYREELFIAAAGPLVSIAAALLSAFMARAGSSWEEGFLFAGLNVIAGLFNLLPAGPLDGGRMVRIWLLHRHSMSEGEAIYRRFTVCFSMALLFLGIYHMARLGGNLTLLCTGLWLLAGARRGGYD